jgi:hypothetical protein
LYSLTKKEKKKKKEEIKALAIMPWLNLMGILVNFGILSDASACRL